VSRASELRDHAGVGEEGGVGGRRDHARAHHAPQHPVHHPVRREDIYQLATEIDDVVDYLEEASDLLGLYGVEMPTRHAVEQCAVIVQACEQLAFACDNLKGMHGVQQALVELKSLEDAGDRILRDALGALFRGEAIDPLIVIRWKDIYEALERALDACETAANVIANIVVKNA
ncbi:MAG: DUF47 domain-containing protein, partial [Gaiellaceae bacterium]